MVVSPGRPFPKRIGFVFFDVTVADVVAFILLVMLARP